MNKKILIIEDEKRIVDILTLNLKMAGYDTICAYDGKTGLELALSQHPDLILLDVMLPYMDGFAVCTEFRKTDTLTPVIMLTAREEERDMIYGLGVGADDYITKPFSIRALLARVQTNIRRSANVSTTPTPTRREETNGRFSLDTARSAAYKDSVMLDLTQREYDLILCLMKEPGRVFSREELMQEVWQYDYYGDLRAVDVAVRRLREKVEDDAANPSYIRTKRGVGYYFAKMPEA